MYKVIIAEDELFVRMGVKMSVDWGKMGMEVVADVENGQQALDSWELLKPDIVVTDIKMPVMDGIALIRKIREKDERTRVIILSCLEEFHIVREALSLGVSDYVLKLTMTQEDMEQVLEKVRRELEILDRNASDAERENSIEKQQFEDELRSWLYYRLNMGNEKRAVIEKTFPNPEAWMRIVVMEIDHYAESKRIFKDSYGSLLEATIENILSELLEGINHIQMIEKEGRSIMILEDTYGEMELSEELSRLLEKIREVFKRYVKSTVSFGISGCGKNCEDLYEMYHCCTQALEKKFFYGTDRNLVYHGAESEECRMMIRRKMERLSRRMKEDGNARRLNEAAEAFCQHENPITIRHYFEHAINVELGRILPENQQRYEIIEQFVSRVEQSETLDETLGVYEDALDFLQNKENGGTDGQLSKQVKEILLFISQHYAEDITLEQIAQMVELSRTYVSALFKKEVGVNLTNYITNCRIEKAKELLRNTNMKSYEIALQVGFFDESYFSRIFKKITGQSPNSYKRGLQQK